MEHNGGCRCGAVRYEFGGPPVTRALCHWSDCRRHAGAPVVGWLVVERDAVWIARGTP
jgi:hypothetical protein